MAFAQGHLAHLSYFQPPVLPHWEAHWSVTLVLPPGITCTLCAAGVPDMQERQ